MIHPDDAEQVFELMRLAIEPQRGEGDLPEAISHLENLMLGFGPSLSRDVMRGLDMILRRLQRLQRESNERKEGTVACPLCGSMSLKE